MENKEIIEAAKAEDATAFKEKFAEAARARICQKIKEKRDDLTSNV